MKSEDKYKDGVTLMAEAIRREQAEELKKQEEALKNSKNVSDATAQFSGKQTPKQTTAPAPAPQPEPQSQPEESHEPDGTMYTDSQV